MTKGRLGTGKRGSGLSSVTEFSNGLNLPELQFLHCESGDNQLIVSMEAPGDRIRSPRSWAWEEPLWNEVKRDWKEKKLRANTDTFYFRVSCKGDQRNWVADGGRWSHRRFFSVA